MVAFYGTCGADQSVAAETFAMKESTTPTLLNTKPHNPNQLHQNHQNVGLLLHLHGIGQHRGLPRDDSAFASCKGVAASAEPLKRGQHIWPRKQVKL